VFRPTDWRLNPREGQAILAGRDRRSRGGGRATIGAGRRYSPRVTTRDELDALSSRELHDLALRRALHHVDVEFLWELLRAIPAAEASEGHDTEAGRDITKVTALIADAIDSGKGDVAEALRPIYIDYLAKHGTSS
jgi:hypothetical protein